MDIDFMDNLLLDGCWLETMNGNEFLQNSSPPNFSALLDSPFSLSNNDSDSRVGGSLPPHEDRDDTHEGFELDKLMNEGDELRRRCWIRLRAIPGPGTPVMDGLIRAIMYIQEFTKGKDVLLQIWVPVNRGDKCVLTTNKQPFSLDPGGGNLSRYREISENYKFSAEKDSEELFGLPSRVFLGKVPELSPNVRFFRGRCTRGWITLSDSMCRGRLHFPVFEQGNKTCLGVIEVVTTTQKINYDPEIETVPKVLEAIDLTCSVTTLLCYNLVLTPSGFLRI